MDILLPKNGGNSMRTIDEREKALNLYFNDKKSAEKISGEMGIPLGTIKAWIHRYKRDNDISAHVLREDIAYTESELITLEKKYKTREKTPGQTSEQRIVKLEMEVDLLRNFLLEKERRSIRK